jgi:hypothetical protein
MTSLSSYIHPTKDGKTYDIGGGDLVLVFPLATKLQEKFGLDAGRFPAFGLDGTYVELKKNDIEIIVGWDIWSDLFVMTTNKNGEQLFMQIIKYLNENLEELGDLQDKLLAELEEKKE